MVSMQLFFFDRLRVYLVFILYQDMVVHIHSSVAAFSFM